MFKHKFWLLVSLAVISAWLCSPVNAETQYYFTYYYNNDSSHTFSGYMYAPDGWYSAGSTIANQPGPMGRAALGGYYYITSTTTGASYSYDKQEYITSATDSHMTSYSIWDNPNYDGGSASSDHSLYIADRSQNDEAHVTAYDGTQYGYAYVSGYYTGSGSGTFQPQVVVADKYGFDLHNVVAW